MPRGVAKRQRVKIWKRQNRLDKVEERFKGKRKRLQREQIVVREINSIGRSTRPIKKKTFQDLADTEMELPGVEEEMKQGKEEVEEGQEEEEVEEGQEEEQKDVLMNN